MTTNHNHILGGMMTRKDYQAVADALKAMGTKTENWQAVTLAALALAPVFEADNPRFDSERFFNACGLIWTSVGWVR
jgi:hypothetical protein